MPEPKTLVERLEKGSSLPTGDLERFFGYGVMGLTFTSGHVLGLRRFPASSVGPGYTSVWHRHPAEHWTFYQDVSPHLACPRYFGGALSEALVRAIALTWSGARSFSVTIGDGAELYWQGSLISTTATWLINAWSGALPEGLWRNATFLKGMGGVAGLALRAGHIGLVGQAPNGQSFVANPRQIWMVGSSTASLGGQVFGGTGPLQRQARLSDFWIPQRGVFAIGGATFEAYDALRHTLRTSSQQASA